jgi:hypothetical protein
LRSCRNKPWCRTLIRMRPEVQVLPGPPPALIRGNAGQHARSLLGGVRGGSRTLTWLPLLVMSRTSRATAVRGHSWFRKAPNRPSASVTVAGAPLEAANRNLRAQVGFLNVFCHGSALGDAWRARPLVGCAVGRGSREARSGACHRGQAYHGMLVEAGRRLRLWRGVMDAVAREHAQGGSRCRSRAAAWCG